MTTRFSTKSIMLFDRINRIIGSIYYWLRSGWRPLLLWFVIVALLVCLPDYITLVLTTKAGIWPRWLNILILQWWNAWLQQWKTVLAFYTLLLLLWWVWQARKRVVIESFIDYTADKPSPDPQGLATLLVVNLAQLHELYRVVDEQRSISMDAGPRQSIDATIKAEDVSGFLQGAVSAQFQLSLGPFVIPIGTLLALIGHLVQGPRIIGSLHKDRDVLILTAQRVGGKQPVSWRVEGRPQQLPAQGNLYDLSAMIEELAYRIFTDLALNGSVRWRATSAFSHGLREYRECLRTPKDSKLKLQRAEKKFIETLVEDQEFVLAHYNLGVVYTELSRLEGLEQAFRKPTNSEKAQGQGKRSYSEAAEQAFIKAIALDPRSWRACYALAVNRCDQGKFESAIRLYKRVLELGPGIADTAKTYHAMGIAQSFLSQENNNQEKLAERHLSLALGSYKKAVELSWKALHKAELTKRSMTEAENHIFPQLETIVSVCLTTLAKAHSDQGKKYYEQRNWKKAQKSFKSAGGLFTRALYLTPYNSEEYLKLVNFTAENHFDLGKSADMLNNYKLARKKFEKATSLNIDEYKYQYKYQAYLAQAYAHSSASSRDVDLARYHCEKVKEALKFDFDADDTFTEALDKIKNVYELLHDDNQINLIEEMKTFFNSLAEGGSGRELKIRNLEKNLEDLERKRIECNNEEWKYIQLSFALGNAYLQVEASGKVERYFRIVIEALEEKYPQEIRKQELRAFLIYSLLAQKKYNDAIKEAEHAFLHEPFCLFERKALGDTYFSMNEFGQAIHAWQDALFRKDAFLRKGTFLPKLPELLKRSNISDINFNIGLAYLELAQQSVEPSQRKAAFQQAATYLKQYLDQGDKYNLQMESYYFLGILYLDSGQYEEAIAHFRLATQLQFAPLHSLFYLGYAYLKNAEYDNSLTQFETLLNEALELYRQAALVTTIVEAGVKTASADPLSLGEIIILAYWGQAFIYAERDTNLPHALELIGHAQEYIEKIEKGREAHLQYPARYSDCKGWILYKQGKIDDAIKCFECALSKTADAEVYLHLALAYERKLKTCKDDVQLFAQLEACCLHAQKLDFKNECEPVVRDILQRIHGQTLYR